jgi:hypothetical protein
VDCILRVGNAGEGEQASVIGLLAHRCPALERIYHEPPIQPAHDPMSRVTHENVVP